MSRSVREIADHVRAHLIGEGNIEISGVSSLTSAVAGTLVFVESEKKLGEALRCSAAAVIAGEFSRDVPGAKPVLISQQPRLAFARAAELLNTPRVPTGRIDPSALIPASVQLDASVQVDAGVVFGEEVSVGEGSWIGAGCVLGNGVEVGRHCKLYPRVTIYSGTRIGDHVVVHAGAVLGADGFGYVREPETRRYIKFPQIGRLRIEDDVEIGVNTTIDRGALDETRIGRGSRIDNLVHVGHNVQIGERVLIAAQTGISGSSVIGDDVVIAGQVGIADHVIIESGVILGAQCGIPTKKVIRGKGNVFWGTPARPIKEYLKQLAAVARLARRG